MISLCISSITKITVYCLSFFFFYWEKWHPPSPPSQGWRGGGYSLPPPYPVNPSLDNPLLQSRRFLGNFSPTKQQNIQTKNIFHFFKFDAHVVRDCRIRTVHIQKIRTVQKLPFWNWLEKITWRVRGLSVPVLHIDVFGGINQSYLRKMKL